MAGDEITGWDFRLAPETAAGFSRFGGMMDSEAESAADVDGMTLVWSDSDGRRLWIDPKDGGWIATANLDDAEMYRLLENSATFHEAGGFNRAAEAIRARPSYRGVL